MKSRRVERRPDQEELLRGLMQDLDRVVGALPTAEERQTDPIPSQRPAGSVPRTLGVGFGLGLTGTRR